MAAGDVFSDTSSSLAATTLVSIRPAVGVQVMITSVFADSTDIYFYGGGTNFTYFPDATGSSRFFNDLGGGSSLKLFLTNAEYINLYNIDAIAHEFGYTGIEI
tara:strand:+ start:106 stop:414 length:309 start_codon:yes stop_codon:yes gene_type:complete